MRMPLPFLLAVFLLAGAPCVLASDAPPPMEGYGEGDGASYGAPVPLGKPVGIAEAAADPDAFAGEGLFHGRITQVCQKEGCWVVLEEDGDFARVMFADHAFAVPKDASGDAIVAGSLEVAPVDAAQAAHLEEDGAARPAARELRIVATGIRIFPVRDVPAPSSQ